MLKATQWYDQNFDKRDSGARNEPQVQVHQNIFGPKAIPFNCDVIICLQRDNYMETAAS